MGTVTVELTNGFGNNIFQYVAARQLAYFLKSELIVLPPEPDYYAIPDLEKMGIKISQSSTHREEIIIDDSNYLSSFNRKIQNKNITVSGYFENYKYFIENLDLIKPWFPEVTPRQDNDLVLHFRGGDRLFYKNGFDSNPPVENFLNAINKFDFDRLHIVTDMSEWRPLTNSELNDMKFHYDAPPSSRVNIETSTEYFNSIVEGLLPLDPIIRHGSVGDDFNYIRTFKNILFQHGTLSWWAAFLSDADKVGVYGPWRPWKADSNKNLSDVKLDRWFKWE
jgi:hypothetical protein